MKKLIATLTLATIATGVFAQGQVTFVNLTGHISTNTDLSPFEGGGDFDGFGGPGVSGPISPAANGFYFTLLFDTAGTPANNNPLTAGWNQMTIGGVPVIGTNFPGFVGDMVGPKAGGTMLPDNWAAGQAGSFIIVGWSANLGTTWSTVLGEFADDWGTIGYDNYYWFGVSSIGTATPSALPSGPTQLWPIVGNTFTLYEVGAIPEPATLALAAFGGASLLLFRRRK